MKILKESYSCERQAFKTKKIGDIMLEERKTVQTYSVRKMTGIVGANATVLLALDYTPGHNCKITGIRNFTLHEVFPKKSREHLVADLKKYLTTVPKEILNNIDIPVGIDRIWLELGSLLQTKGDLLRQYTLKTQWEARWKRNYVSDREQFKKSLEDPEVIAKLLYNWRLKCRYLKENCVLMTSTEFGHIKTLPFAFRFVEKISKEYKKVERSPGIGAWAFTKKDKADYGRNVYTDVYITYSDR